jgi:hypothetical protein
MGWLWQSPPEEGKLQSRGSETLQSIPTSKSIPSSTDSSSKPSKPSKPLSRDEQADLELRDLLASLSNSNEEGGQKTSKSADQALDISADSLYPSEMSCQQAFDAAFYCQSLGGQFTNVYRYGELRNCKEEWGNFWFCMRTKSYQDPEKGTMIRDHFRRKALKYKTGPSSEDVWEARTTPLEGAFMASIDVEDSASNESNK